MRIRTKQNNMVKFFYNQWRGGIQNYEKCTYTIYMSDDNITSYGNIISEGDDVISGGIYKYKIISGSDKYFFKSFSHFIGQIIY